MNPIRILSASAGSGKTYRLVEVLEEEIAAGRVRPEAVLATTFTVKAAAELRERVRARLLERGQIEAAQRLGGARIGTVNSVCGQLVSDFAFDLGLSPEPRVLDQDAATPAFGRALSMLIRGARAHADGEEGETDEDGAATLFSSAAVATLAELSERWKELDWLSAVREIVSRARLNIIGPKDLPECARRSVISLLAYLPAPVTDGERLEADLAAALEGFISGAVSDATKTTAEVVQVATQALARLGARHPLTWWEWARLTTQEPGARSKAIYEPVRAAAGEHVRHPRLRQDVQRCIEMVFDVAGQALAAYESYKRTWGLMDFVDQEVLALELLRMPHVREQLSDQIDLVLVDEFQDTSPLQLALFLTLAGLAKRSVWVGDQKQAIFGFRDTDPALMNSAIEGIIERWGKEGFETLAHSWRSRPDLVHLSSRVFAAAFEAHGIPRERVLLEAARKEPTPGLGPVVERWNLQSRNQGQDAAALAAAVREFLDDATVQVEDVVTGERRRPRRSDIAISCQTWAVAGQVADALQSTGIPAVLPRKGLLSTPEALVMLAGLRLWVDPLEPLAAAELGRLLEHADAGDDWLGKILAKPGEAFRDLPGVTRIATAAAGRPAAGPLQVFDAVLEALEVPTLCLRWGNATQRLANLEQLRALAAAYVERCEAEMAGCTVAGLVTDLLGLVDDGKDDQAVPSGGDAVAVMVYHAVKGLEWPVVVLYQLDRLKDASPFGVRVVTDQAKFAFDTPLAGRWIRYWPDPFAPQSKTPFHDEVAAGEESRRATMEDRRERLRLLYVGWTRARDRLILAARPGKLVDGWLSLLVDGQGNALISEPGPTTTWAGVPIPIAVRDAAPGVAVQPTIEPESGYVADGPRPHPPAWVEPSRVSGTASAGPVEKIGDPLSVNGKPHWANLGTACHAFFAADRPGLSEGERLEIARLALEHWAVQGSLRAEDLVVAGSAFKKWVTDRWPKAKWHREWPVRLRMADGAEMVGSADLILEDEDGFTVVDHKCLAGAIDEAVESSLSYGGQLAAYADIVEAATGKKVRGRIVHLVFQGTMVELVVGVNDRT